MAGVLKCLGLFGSNPTAHRPSDPRKRLKTVTLRRRRPREADGLMAPTPLLSSSRLFTAVRVPNHQNMVPLKRGLCHHQKKARCPLSS